MRKSAVLRPRPAPAVKQQEQALGLATAFGAFSLWGFLPLYFYIIDDRVPVTGILGHRIIWAAVLLGAFTLLASRLARVAAVLRNRRMLLALTGSTAFISVNWGVFIWAVTHGHVLEASLGYYINPLLNVLLGFIFLRERLRPPQAVAVAIAAVGVLIMIIGYGHIPWVSLILAGCFGAYGLIRKQVAVDSGTGLLVETLLLAPFALAWLGWLYANREAAFLVLGIQTSLLLFGCGIVTVIPLVLFATGARRLRLGTLGLIQYITPTLQLLTGVLLMGEPFSRADAVTFTLIWVGLFIYTTDALAAQRRARQVGQGETA